MKYKNIILLSSVTTLALAACGNMEVEQKYPTSNKREGLEGGIYEEPGTIFGDNKGLFSTRRGDDDESDDSGAKIGVNTYLWRASLDTVSFMPIQTADPFGGTIFTDWYEDPSKPGERFKLNVFILDRELKADGVRVRVFKQTGYNGNWKDAAAPEEMGRQLEDSILTRARQMRAKKLGPLG
jgi:hypothetical protein